MVMRCTGLTFAGKTGFLLYLRIWLIFVIYLVLIITFLLHHFLFLHIPLQKHVIIIICVEKYDDTAAAICISSFLNST